MRTILRYVEQEWKPELSRILETGRIRPNLAEIPRQIPRLGGANQVRLLSGLLRISEERHAAVLTDCV
jgi:hypothetical protein